MPKQRWIQKLVLVVTTTSFYSNFVFRKFINKPILLINPPTVFAFFML